jgi:hypothetical protein
LKENGWKSGAALDIQAGINKLRTEPVYGDQPDRKGGKVTKATGVDVIHAPAA